MNILKSASSTDELPDLCTAPQLSVYLQIPISTVYKWRTENKGPKGIKIGGHLRYRKSDILAYLADAA